jgi:hypothetical protein
MTGFKHSSHGGLEPELLASNLEARVQSPAEDVCLLAERWSPVPLPLIRLGIDLSGNRQMSVNTFFQLFFQLFIYFYRIYRLFWFVLYIIIPRYHITIFFLIQGLIRIINFINAIFVRSSLVRTMLPVLYYSTGHHFILMNNNRQFLNDVQTSKSRWLGTRIAI